MHLLRTRLTFALVETNFFDSVDACVSHYLFLMEMIVVFANFLLWIITLKEFLFLFLVVLGLNSGPCAC
jgi:hypothetical protein